MVLFMINSNVFFFSASCMFGRMLRPRRGVQVRILLKVGSSPTKTKCGIGRDGVTVNSKKLFKGNFLGNARAGLGCIPRRSASFVFYAVNRRRKFINSTFIVFLFVTLVLHLVILSRQRRDHFKEMCNCYMLDVFFFRLFVGVKVILKLAPIVNVPLPFFDCNNSSL